MIDSLFSAVPNAYLPLLEYNSRLDMLDLYNCGMTAKVYNDLSGEACLLQKDSLHFLVQTTASSSLEFQVLDGKSDTVYSCIRTVRMPEKQSQVVFTNTRWRPIKIKLPKQIGLEDCWFPNDSLSDDRIENLRLALTPAYFHAHWECGKGQSPVLVYEVSVEGLMPEDQKAAASCLKPLRFKWAKEKLMFEE